MNQAVERGTLEWRGDEDLRDRPAIPDVLEVRGRVAFEQGSQVDVRLPFRHADGEVAERIRADVDASGEQAVALPLGERPIVPDNLANRIGNRLLLRAAIVRRGTRRTDQATARGRIRLQNLIDAG